ncbi:MAG: response regulator [Deltaproteobacteria bacterium]|nr:response regulator [Deltaproteobacteria bacterium]
MRRRRPSKLAAREGAAGGEAKEEEALHASGVSSTKTVLIIEDEEAVSDVTQGMLEKLGYRVIVAKTGKDAIYTAETFDGQIDLALLDINLPDMEGGKLYPLLMKARPNLKVIVFSGYTIDGLSRKILNAGAQDFLQKPFSLAILSEKLKKVLVGE